MAQAKKEEAPEKKGPNKLVIIIAAVVVLLLLGGGGAAWFLMKGGKEPAKEHAASGEKKGAEEGGHGAEGAKQPPLYYEIKPGFLASLPPGGKFKLLSVTVHILTKHQTMVDFLKAHDPKVKNDLLNLLIEQDGEALKTRAGKEKLQAAAKAKLEEMAKEMGAEGKILNVYFSKLVME